MKTILNSEEKNIKDIVFKFIDPSKYKIFIFGSRATGKARKFVSFFKI